MQVQFHEITLETSKHVQLVDITRDVEGFVTRSAVANGICLIHASHATAAIILNENEPGLLHDIEKKFVELFDSKYKHDNASAHMGSIYLGATKILPVRDGKLQRGTWQNILFLEMDGPRNDRRVIIEVLGD